MRFQYELHPWVSFRQRHIRARIVREMTHRGWVGLSENCSCTPSAGPGSVNSHSGWRLIGQSPDTSPQAPGVVAARSRTLPLVHAATPHLLGSTSTTPTAPTP